MSQGRVEPFGFPCSKGRVDGDGHTKLVKNSDG